MTTRGVDVEGLEKTLNLVVILVDGLKAGYFGFHHDATCEMDEEGMVERGWSTGADSSRNGRFDAP